MSMPIQRQSESFGIFDDGPRYARDRTTLDIPKGLAGLINTTGPRIQGGMMNTRTAANEDEMAELDREHHERNFPYGDYTGDVYPEDESDGKGLIASRTAVNTHGMDPESHAYNTELPYGPGPGREYNPDFREYEPSDEDERRQEAVGEDDDSGYNWGPEPRRASRHPFDRTAGAWQDLIDKDSPGPFEGDDPEDFFTNWLARGREEEQPRHRESGRITDFMRGGHTPDHEIPWEETDEGWHHPQTGQKIIPSDDTPGHWQLVAPTVPQSGSGGVSSGFAKIRAPHADPQAIMDWQNYAMGGSPPEGHKPKFRDHIFPPNPIPDRQASRRFLAFDWKPVKWADPEATDEMYRAKLENGHALSCYQLPDDPDHGWMWSIYEPVKPGEHPNVHAMRYVTGGGGEGLHPTFDHARQAAEEAYQQRYPIGTDTGSHDSGNNYTDLGSYMKHLEGYRLAADGMSYDDTISHIDQVLAEGEGHELHNYPGAGAKPLPVRSRGELASSPLSPDECVLYHPHDGEECQDLADIHWHNDGRHHDYSHPPMPYMEGSKRVSGEMPMMDPSQMQIPQGGGYQIGHRVGLPWRENVIPGTVIGLDGPNTNIRWDDGQYSTEEPRNIQLL